MACNVHGHAGRLWDAGVVDWWLTGLVVLCIAGVAVIGYGALRDRHNRLRRIAELSNPPARSIPQLPADAEPPTYLTRAQAHRSPTRASPASAPAAQTTDSPDPAGPEQGVPLERQLTDPRTTQVGVGYASADFVTDAVSDRAVLHRPRVLVSAEPIMAIRELIGPLEHMIADRSAIVIAAPAMAPEVCETLQVNRIQGRIRVLAVLTKDPVPLDTICAASGARLIGRVDLQSGYVADADLGRCHCWVSDRTTSYLIPTGDGSHPAPDQP